MSAGAETALAKLDTQALLSAAVEHGASIELLERLVALAKDVRAVQAEEAYHQALAEFQAKSLGKLKAAQGNRNRYVKLPTLLAEVQPRLAAVGITLSWRTRMVPGGVVVSCRLAHKQGHTEDSGELELPTGISDGATPAQRVGSAVSYGKRYTLLDVLGLAPDLDDDGAGGAATAPRREEPAPAAFRKTGDPKRDELLHQLHEAFNARRMDSAARVTWLREAFADVPLERVELEQLRLAVDHLQRLAKQPAKPPEGTKA